MMDLFDDYLESVLRHWVSSRRPPLDGKARLLDAASLQSLRLSRKTFVERLLNINRDNKSERNWFGGGYRFNDPFHGFNDWSIVYTLEVSMVNIRLRI